MHPLGCGEYTGTLYLVLPHAYNFHLDIYFIMCMMYHNVIRHIHFIKLLCINIQEVYAQTFLSLKMHDQNNH